MPATPEKSKTKLQKRKRRKISSTKRPPTSPLNDIEDTTSGGKTGSVNSSSNNGHDLINENTTRTDTSIQSVNSVNTNTFISEAHSVNTSFDTSFLSDSFFVRNPFNMAFSQPLQQEQNYTSFNMQQSQPQFSTGQLQQQQQQQTTPIIQFGQVQNQQTSTSNQTQYDQAPPIWATEILQEIKTIKEKMSVVEKIERTVDVIKFKVTDLEGKVSGIDSRLNEVEKTCAFLGEVNDSSMGELNSARAELAILRKSQNALENKTKHLTDINQTLEEQITDLEARSMRDNLMFYGIPEEGENEDCEKLVKGVCKEALQIPEAESMRFDRVHRVGSRDGRKPRPVVAKFHYYKDRETVRTQSYSKMDDLKRNNMGIGVQWPKKIRETRKELYPIMQREKAKGKSVKMVRDKLYINGTLYSTGSNAMEH